MTVSSADHHDLSVVCEAQAYQKVDHLAEEGEGGGGVGTPIAASLSTGLLFVIK